jgi:hypothetical protein
MREITKAILLVVCGRAIVQLPLSAQRCANPAAGNPCDNTLSREEYQHDDSFFA